MLMRSRAQSIREFAYCIATVWWGERPREPGWSRRRSARHERGLRIYPESGYIVVVVSNQDAPAASRISQFIRNRLRGHGIGLSSERFLKEVQFRAFATQGLGFLDGSLIKCRPIGDL